MTSREERAGTMLLLITCVTEGLFPIVAFRASSLFPPVLFVGVSTGIAALIFFLYTLLRGKLRQPIPLRAIGYCLGVAIFIVLTFAIIITASGYTSGINTALLLQSEIIFTFLFTTFLLKEKYTKIQLCGAFVIFTGTIFILFNGTFTFNYGDLAIVFATALFPIGNTFAKKALKLITPSLVLLFRYVFGSAILLTAAFFMGDITSQVFALSREQIVLIVTYSILILVVSKIFWYEGLKRLKLGKAIYIFSATPAFSMLFAFMFLAEIPTIYQFAGFILVLWGLYHVMSPTKSKDLV